jgi:hypothetical protein
MLLHWSLPAWVVCVHGEEVYEHRQVLLWVRSHVPHPWMLVWLPP